MTSLVRQPRPLRRSRVRSALVALSPVPFRVRSTRRRWTDEMPAWLRPAAREALLEAVLDDERRRPLSFAASVRTVPRMRALVEWTRNRRILALHARTDVSSPLLHRDLVDALAREGGVLGRGDRTRELRALVPDLLPDAVLARTTKAMFNTCYVSGHSRAFAEGWGGDGVDHDLVDPERLRDEWLAERPSATTGALLQQAWLAARAPGASRSGDVPRAELRRGGASWHTATTAGRRARN